MMEDWMKDPGSSSPSRASNFLDIGYLDELFAHPNRVEKKPELGLPARLDWVAYATASVWVLFLAQKGLPVPHVAWNLPLGALLVFSGKRARSGTASLVTSFAAGFLAAAYFSPGFFRIPSLVTAALAVGYRIPRTSSFAEAVAFAGQAIFFGAWAYWFLNGY